MPMAEIEYQGPGAFWARLMRALRGSAVWLGTVAFAALAALAAFFFALAALAGVFILVGAFAFVWLIFRLGGSRSVEAESGILDARRGPRGWTVDGLGPFGSR